MDSCYNNIVNKPQLFNLVLILTMFAAVSTFAPTVIFADNATGLEPPQTAYIEAQQSSDGTVAYKIKSLFNKDWLANAKVTWKAHIACGTFTGTTFNPAGCGNLKTINDNNAEMRICVFFEHKNGQILFGSYPERGFTHGYGDALHTPNADELVCYGSTKERTAPTPGPSQNPAGQPAQQPGAQPNPQPNGQPKSSGTPWIVGGLVLLIAGGFVYVKKKMPRGKDGDEKKKEKHLCEDELAKVQSAKKELEAAKKLWKEMTDLYEAYRPDYIAGRMTTPAALAYEKAGGRRVRKHAIADYQIKQVLFNEALEAYRKCTGQPDGFIPNPPIDDMPEEEKANDKKPYTCQQEFDALKKAEARRDSALKATKKIEALWEDCRATGNRDFGGGSQRMAVNRDFKDGAKTPELAEYEKAGGTPERMRAKSEWKDASSVYENALSLYEQCKNKR